MGNLKSEKEIMVESDGKMESFINFGNNQPKINGSYVKMPL